MEFDSPRDILRHRPFQFFFVTRSFSRFAMQISSVAIGWQFFDLSGSAFYLGLAGLTQFLPTAILVFVAGHVADRYDRRRVLQACLSMECLVAVALALGNFLGFLTVPWIFAALAVLGPATAFESPATAAILPAVAPPGRLPQATALSAGGNQLAIIVGPALGGLSYAISPGVPYAIMTLLWLFSSLMTRGIHLERPAVPKEMPTLGALFGGVRFVRDNPNILGVISRDLFAGLFGGATALLPIFARDILHTGPWGLGLLRAAPAVGALLMSFWLARHDLARRVGMI